MTIEVDPSSEIPPNDERMVVCPKCQGDSRRRDPCVNCEGSGQVQADEVLGSDAHLRTLQRFLLRCHNDERASGCVNVSQDELRALLERAERAPAPGVGL